MELELSDEDDIIPFVRVHTLPFRAHFAVQVSNVVNFLTSTSLRGTGYYTKEERKAGTRDGEQADENGRVS